MLQLLVFIVWCSGVMAWLAIPSQTPEPETVQRDPSRVLLEFVVAHHERARNVVAAVSWV
jgi:hypothetical protein